MSKRPFIEIKPSRNSEGNEFDLAVSRNGFQAFVIPLTYEELEELEDAIAEFKLNNPKS